jgi:hypothetical protein
MKFRVTLPETGAELAVDVSLPAATFRAGRLPSPAAAGRAIAAWLVPQIAAALEPGLPPTAPARMVVKRDEKGSILGFVEHPATRLRQSALAGSPHSSRRAWRRNTPPPSSPSWRGRSIEHGRSGRFLSAP